MEIKNLPFNLAAIVLTSLLLSSCQVIKPKTHILTTIIDQNLNCQFVYDGSAIDLHQNNYRVRINKDLIYKKHNGYMINCFVDTGDVNLASDNRDLASAIYVTSPISPLSKDINSLYEALTNGIIYKCGFIDQFGGITDHKLVYFSESKKLQKPKVYAKKHNSKNLKSISINCELKETSRSHHNYWI